MIKIVMSLLHPYNKDLILLKKSLRPKFVHLLA